MLPQIKIFVFKGLKLGFEVSTVKKNRDRDKDVSTCRDVLFQTVEKTFLNCQKSRF
jgi:hypothetical protein